MRQINVIFRRDSSPIQDNKDLIPKSQMRTINLTDTSNIISLLFEGESVMNLADDNVYIRKNNTVYKHSIERM